MIASERGIRMRIVKTARRLVALGLSPATSGNLSARSKGGYLITPSGAAYESLGPDDIVFMGDDWTHSGGQKPPSSEWRLHRDIYRTRAEAGGVVHVHSTAATALACLRRSIPPFHYEVAFAGGRDIRCSEYATFGTQELSAAAAKALEGRRACLLANHGAITFAETVEDAALLAERVENLARLYLTTLPVSEPVLLDDAEMARVVAKFRAYGKPQA
ncbi:MAG TPA: class II aldolase/adducin family protein [Usitatibacter sp.]|nr:class II aldolase/adducin family protein [Usitatibacter sp.]